MGKGGPQFNPYFSTWCSLDTFLVSFVLWHTVLLKLGSICRLGELVISVPFLLLFSFLERKFMFFYETIECTICRESFSPPQSSESSLTWPLSKPDLRFLHQAKRLSASRKKKYNHHFRDKHHKNTISALTFLNVKIWCCGNTVQHLCLTCQPFTQLKYWMTMCIV